MTLRLCASGSAPSRIESGEILDRTIACAPGHRLLLATGKFLGEGFDDPRLDTLFLTMPISWRGTLSQYAGRLHRLYDRKTEVIIYDYADTKIPMTLRMFERRLAGYRAIGYRIAEDGESMLFN